MLHTVIIKEQDFFTSTAVENLFITDLMPAAPGNAVKAYLYGLMQLSCGSESTVDIASALNLTDDEILDCFRYWERQGIVKLVEGETLNIQYLNTAEALKKAPSSMPNAGRYAGLIEKLRIVLGTRNFSGSELQKVYDWISCFGFEDDAAIEIVRHCIELKGTRVHINYMDSVAKRLAADNILTYEKVRENFETETGLMRGAGAILKRWHIKRMPTDDEVALYEKWTKEWGFKDDSISLACADVVAADRPNFKYLDAILTKYHESGSISAESMAAAIKEQEMIEELARQAFARAGMKRTPNISDRRQFEIWSSDWCLSPELILYSAEAASLKATPFAEMKKLLEDWHQRGIVSVAAAKDEIAKNASKPEAKRKSVNRALNYKQRQYTADQLREMGVDLGEDVYED